MSTSYILQQSVNANLMRKYDTKFNFFFAKPISEIIYNQADAQSTLDFKDIIVYSQSSQYLKRLYYTKNSAGRNQIFDRIQMLADFYYNAVILKYELPMMIISNTKDIFLKRLKRMKKMIASDCSSQQSSSHHSLRSSQAQSFSSSIFIRTIRTEQLEQSSKQNSLIANCKKNERLYDAEYHDIYAEKSLDLTETFYRPQIKPIKLQINSKSNGFQNGLKHLIIDIDDVDKQKAVNQYKKVQQRQNIDTSQLYSKKGKDGNIKKSSIIITAIDHYPLPLPDHESESGAIGNYYPKNSKNSKKVSNNINRYKQEMDEMEDLTIKLGNYNSNYVVGNLERGQYYNSRNSRQIPTYRSPSFGVGGNSTQRNIMYMNSPNNVHATIKNYEHKNDIQMESRRLARQRIYTQTSNTQTQSQLPIHQHYNHQSRQQFLNLNQIQGQQNQTIYLTHQNSVSQVSGKDKKKQNIRQRAAALLQKVKSEQKLSLFKQQVPKRLTRHQSNARFMPNQ